MKFHGVCVGSRNRDTWPLLPRESHLIESQSEYELSTGRYWSRLDNKNQCSIWWNSHVASCCLVASHSLQTAAWLFCCKVWRWTASSVGLSELRGRPAAAPTVQNFQFASDWMTCVSNPEVNFRCVLCSVFWAVPCNGFPERNIGLLRE